MSSNNQVIEVYKGIKIRNCNRVVIKLGAATFKKILDEVDKTGLPIPKLLAYSSRPCERCKDIEVCIFDKNEEQIFIKRGLLSSHIPEGNGINLIKQSQNKK